MERYRLQGVHHVLLPQGGIFSMIPQPVTVSYLIVQGLRSHCPALGRDNSHCPWVQNSLQPKLHRRPFTKRPINNACYYGGAWSVTHCYPGSIDASCIMSNQRTEKTRRMRFVALGGAVLWSLPCQLPPSDCDFVESLLLLSGARCGRN